MTDAHFSMKRKMPCENMSDEIGPLYHSSLFAKCETNHIRFSKCFCMNYTKTSWLYRIQQILTEWKFSIYFFAVFVNEIHYVCVTIFGIQRESERNKEKHASTHISCWSPLSLIHIHIHIPLNFRQTIIKEILDWFCFVYYYRMLLCFRIFSSFFCQRNFRKMSLCNRSAFPVPPI